VGRPKSRSGKTKIVAPDDDPAFLRDLSSKLDEKDTKPEANKDESKDKPEEGDVDKDSKDKS
jgi:hypothetical protein